MLTKLCQAYFTQLQSYGSTRETLATKGTTRLSYSDAHLKALIYLEEECHNLQLETSRDAFGNLHIYFPGTNLTLKPLLLGSHLDTVPQGGSYDGALGVLAGLAIFAYWRRISYIPERSVHLIAFAEEEGTLFGQVCLGSRFLCNELATVSPQTISDKNGTSLADYLAKLGTVPPFLKSPIDVPQAYEAFLELHIEQGPVLEEKQLCLGLVRSIVGITRFRVDINGTANHVGTTPMQMRQDSLYAAAKLISQIYEVAQQANGTYVATVGKLVNTPNAENVIPGHTSCMVEFRSEDASLLTQTLPDFLINLIQTVEQVSQTTITWEKTVYIPPVKMDTHLFKKAREVTTSLNLPCLEMPSGAGHDAMIMAKYIPTLMLFVPSHKGISHNPAEYTAWEDIEKGLLVLEKLVRQI